MILLPDIALMATAAAGLRALQAEVDAAGAYADQVAEGKRLFGADYTIKTLRLNIRPELPRARREAYRDYVAHLRHYQHERDARASTVRLAELRETVRRRQHPTVWREMQRQREMLPALRALFEDVPEAAAW